MTGSPHTSMPYAMHHLKPWPSGQGFFCVQDERYTAGAGEVESGNRSRSWPGPRAGAAPGMLLSASTGVTTVIVVVKAHYRPNK